MAAIDNDPSIVTSELTKRFGDEVAVDSVSFEVPKGSIFGYIGPSGSGKTTTIRMLLGIYEPSEGSVQVLGEDPRKFDRRTQEKIGYMPQHFVLYPDLSVVANLSFAASIYGMGSHRGSRMNELLDFVELSEHRGKLARDISGGMQRRLSLAATLLHRPEVVFLDEPTAGIDPVLRRRLWDRFHELAGEGRTLFVTTQYVGETVYCDHVGVMDGSGRLIAVDTPEGLRRRALGGEAVDMELATSLDPQQLDELRTLDFVVGTVTRHGDRGLRLIVEEAGKAMPALIDWASQRGLTVDSMEEYEPPFDDVFVHLVSDTKELWDTSGFDGEGDR